MKSRCPVCGGDRECNHEHWKYSWLKICDNCYEGEVAAGCYGGRKAIEQEIFDG